MPSAFVQDHGYELDDDDKSEKEDEDKGNAENEEGFEILIHSDLPIVTEWYSFKNRIKQPRRKTFSFSKEFLLHNPFRALVFINISFYPLYN